MVTTMDKRRRKEKRAHDVNEKIRTEFVIKNTIKNTKYEKINGVNKRE